MFDTLTRLTSRIARRCRPKRPAAAVAHVASLLAVGLTLMMVGSGHVAESNPASAWLHAQIGLSAWALLTPIGVGAALSLADQLPFARAKWAIAGALGLDALGNLAMTASVGLPESILVEWVTASIVGLALAAGAVYWRVEISAVVVSAPLPSRESVQAVALSILMVTSMIGGVAFVGTQPLSDSQDGVASAAGNWTVNNTYSHHSEDVMAVHVANGYLYTGSHDNTAARVDPDTGEMLTNYTHHSNTVVDLETSDGYLYTSSRDNTAARVDPETGDVLTNYTHHSGTVVDVEVVGGYLYTASTDNTAARVDPETGNVLDTYSHHSDSVRDVEVVDGDLYTASYDNTAARVDPDTGDVLNTYTHHSNWVRDVEVVNGDLYTSSRDNTAARVDPVTGDMLTNYTHHSNQVYNLEVVYGDLYTTSYDNTAARVDPETGDVIDTYDHHSNYVIDIEVVNGDVYTGSYDHTAKKIEDPTIEGPEPVTVQVTDQDGNPINQSTVQATVVDQDALNASDIYDRADQLYDEAENPEPPDFDNHLNLNTEFSETDTTYVSVHPESQMSVVEASTGGLDPDVQVASGEELYFMAWDATDEPGFLESDLINRQLPGSPTDSTIVIEQLDHRGDTTHTRTLDTENPDALAEIGYVSILDDYSRTHASTTLPDGFYRVTTEESDFSYVIAVGDPATTIENEIRDEADHLTDQAKWVQERHNDGLFATKTGVTNETGEVVLDIPASAAAIQIQAYKGPDASTVGASTTADITMQDIRDSREAGYDEAIYLSTDPTRVDMDETDGTETVEVRKLDGPPMENPEEWANRLEDALNEALNASIADLESVYDDRLETVEREELERRHEQLRDIADRAGLLDRVKELLGRELVDTGTGSDAELRADLGAIEQALAEQQSQGSTGETNTEIDSGKLFTEIPFASEIDPEAISVIVHTEAGESITLPDSEYRIESNGLIDGGDTVVIDGYQLPTDTAVADVEVRGVSPAGRTLRERVSAVNPKMAGNVPGLDAIDVNTMRPGPDERVGLQLRPSDEDAYDSLSSVDVYGPDGQTVPATLDGERAHFDTEGQGVYTVRATYAGSDGTEFVETIRLRAGSKMISERPTVRITEGLGGPTAIVGQGLDSATIETTDGETTITARQPGDATSAPGEIHIEAQQLDASNTITVNVVRGELEESVNAHTNVVLHTNEIGDDALVYRDGKPVTADGDTKHGEYETRENADGVTKTVLYTYSESDGTVRMRITEDPGVVERVLFDLRVRSPVDVPLVGMLYGAVELADSVPLGPTAALQTVDTPELREADPGTIVPRTGVVNTPGVVAA